MLPNRDFGVCRVKVGLLILRDCKEAAVAECARCGRGVCGLHQVLRPQFTYCPECAAGLEEPGTDPNAEQEPGTDRLAGAPANAQVDRVRQRREYYEDYGYSPYYYGHHHYFSDSEYHVFGEKGHVVRHERLEAEDAGDGSDGGDGSDAGDEAGSAGYDLDDALES